MGGRMMPRSDIIVPECRATARLLAHYTPTLTSVIETLRLAADEIENLRGELQAAKAEKSDESRSR